MPGQVTTERDAPGRSLLFGAPGFVGREQEMIVLARALQGAPAVVLIEGEAGIGKTRLLQEFLSSPAGRARQTLLACCPPLQTPCTLGPVVDAIRQTADDVRGLGLSDLAGALRPLFPEWAGGLPPAPDATADATAARHRLFRALAELLDRLKIMVLAVEDAHWADEATLEFLLFLSSRQPRPASVVVTCRPEDAPGAPLLLRLSRLAAGTAGTRLMLAPLDVADTASLVSSMLDGQEVSGDFAAFLHQRTDGVPLAVEESVRVMGARADLARSRSGRLMRRHLADIEVPPTVRDAVLDRAGRLSADARAVLHAAAVLAVPATEPLLTAVATLPPGRGAADGICEALGCGLLEESMLNAPGLVSFRHALAARAVYEAIPVPQRQQLHQRAAQALEGQSPLPVARLATHFREAGDIAQWCRYAEQGADLARAAGDHNVVAALLRDLVTGAGLLPGDAARLTAKIPLPVLAPPDKSQLALALRAVLRSAGITSEEEGAVRCQLGRVLVSMDDWNAAGAELERAIPGLVHAPVAAAGTMVLLGLPIGWTDWPASRHAEWLRRAVAVNVAMPPAEELLVRVNRVTALLMLGEDEGWVEAAGIPADAPTAGERLEIIRGYLNVGAAAMLWGRYAEAEHRLDRARDLAEGHGHLPFRDHALVMRAHLDWSAGAWEGLARRAGGLAVNEDVGPGWLIEAELVCGLLAAATAGRAKAEECLIHVMTQARRHGMVEDFMESAGALARLRLTDGRHRHALEVTEEAAGIVARKGVWLWATEIAPPRVGALLAAGRDGEAAALVTAFARGLRDCHAPGPAAALLLCRAHLAEGRGEHDLAASLFGRAASAWQALPRPYDALLARERQARCQLAAGQRDAGLATLGAVLPGLSQLGAASDAGRVAHSLRKHGVTPWRGWRGGRRGYGDQLSPRELEIVRLVAQGQTDREIAASLFVSPKTVARHLDSARRKLNVRSRAALAVTAQAADLIPGQPPASAR